MEGETFSSAIRICEKSLLAQGACSPIKEKFFNNLSMGYYLLSHCWLACVIRSLPKSIYYSVGIMEGLWPQKTNKKMALSGFFKAI